MATGQYTQFPIDWKSLDASQVPYSNSTSGLSATDVQGAIDELNTDLNAIEASDIPYDNTASGLIADDVQEALDELKTDVDGKQATLTAGDGITISSDTISTDNDSTLTSAVKPAQAKAVGDALSAQETATEEALYTKAPVIVDTASGSIASFPDGADSYPLKECVVNIEAVQSGSGDPSPTNVRPISGWSSAKVVRTGKNLLEYDYATKEAWNYSGYVSGSLNLGKDYFVKGQTYTLSGYVENGSSSWVRPRICTVKNNVKTQIEPITDAMIPTGTNSSFSATFVIPNDEVDYYCLVLFKGDTSGTPNINVYHFQLEQGSTASDWEPYLGATFTISLGDTRYGCVLDAVRGKLRVDMVQVTMNDTFGFMMAPNGIIYTPTLTPAPKQTGTKTCICDTFNAIANVQNTSAMESAADQSICVQTASVYKRFLIKDTAHNSSIEAWNAFVAANPIKVVYELATPIEVDLTTTEIATLLGTNNIWADCGDIEVEYCADTKLWILKKIAETSA